MPEVEVLAHKRYVVRLRLVAVPCISVQLFLDKLLEPLLGSVVRMTSGKGDLANAVAAPYAERAQGVVNYG